LATTKAPCLPRETLDVLDHGSAWWFGKSGAREERKQEEKGKEERTWEQELEHTKRPQL